MKKVLIRTLTFTLIAFLINLAVYFSVSRRFHQEAVFIIGALSLAAAVPVMIGYVFANVSLRSPSPILLIAKFILFVFNGSLIIGTTLLTIAIGFEETIAFVSFPYLLGGFYIYYETIQLIRQPQTPEGLSLSENDLLDDFINSEK